MSDVNRIREELSALVAVVEQHGGPSDAVAVNAIASKTLLMSAASHFERSICKVILEVAKSTGSNSVVLEFVNRQALERRYHTMFEWKASNLNKLFALFGDATKKKLSAASQEPEIAPCVADFIFLNAQRNLLAHENFAGANLPATFDEVWTRYQSAEKFADWFEAQLRDAALGPFITETLDDMNSV